MAWNGHSKGNPQGSDFRLRARRIGELEGNTPGFSNEHGYLDGVKGDLDNHAEYLDIPMEQRPLIPQARKVEVKRMTSQVEELPFDQHKWNQTQNMMKVAGFGFLLVGMILFLRYKR